MVKKHHTYQTTLISFWQGIMTQLASMRLAVILLAILTPLTILGTLIPQARPPQEYIAQFGWNGFRILHFFWLTDIFSSFWYVGLLLILGLNILVCSVTAARQKKRHWAFFVTHLSLLILIAGGLVSATARLAGEVKIEVGQSADSFIARGKKIPLGFEIRLKSFKLEKYEGKGEKLRIKVTGEDKLREYFFRPEIWTMIEGTPYEFQVEHFVPDFRYDQAGKRAFSASNEPNNPAIYVHIKGKGKGEDYGEWLFHRFRDFHGSSSGPLKMEYEWAPFVPKGFLSHLEILEKGKVVQEKVINVNHPLRHRGFGIYQASYDSAGEKWSGLQIVKDPGVWLVYLGIAGLMLGLVFNIYVRAFCNERKLKS